MLTTGHDRGFFPLPKSGSAPRLNGSHFLVRGALGLWLPNSVHPVNLVRHQLLPDWGPTATPPTFSDSGYGMDGANANYLSAAAGTYAALQPSAAPVTIGAIYSVRTTGGGAVFSTGAGGSNITGFNLSMTLSTNTVRAYHGPNVGSTFTTASHHRSRESSFQITSERIYVVFAVWTALNTSPSIYINGGIADGTGSGSATAVSHTSVVPYIGRAGASTGASSLRFNGDLRFVGMWNRLLSAEEIRAFSENPMRLFSSHPLISTKQIGVTELLSVGGGITPTGAGLWVPKTKYVGSVSPTGVTSFRANVTDEGNITPVGALSQLPSVSFAGGITPTGNLVPTSLRVAAFTGAIPFAGSLINEVRKTLASTLPLAGTLVHLLNVRYAGSLTPISVLRKVVNLAAGAGATSSASNGLDFFTSGEVFPFFRGLLASTGLDVFGSKEAYPSVQDGAVVSGGGLGGTLPSSGTLSLFRLSFVSATGAITPVGTLVKKVNKIVSGATTPVGALLHRVNKVLSGAITPTGTLATVASHYLSVAGAIIPVGTLVKKVNKAVAGALTPVGTLTTVASHYLSVAGTIAPTGTLLKQVKIAFGGIMGLSGTFNSFTTSLFMSITLTGRVVYPDGGPVRRAVLEVAPHLADGMYAQSVALPGALLTAAAISTVLNSDGTFEIRVIPAAQITPIGIKMRVRVLWSRIRSLFVTNAAYVHLDGATSSTAPVWGAITTCAVTGVFVNSSGDAVEGATLTYGYDIDEGELLYLSDHSAVVSTPRQTITAADGTFTLQLIPSADLTPSGTYAYMRGPDNFFVRFLVPDVTTVALYTLV